MNNLKKGQKVYYINYDKIYTGTFTGLSMSVYKSDYRAYEIDIKKMVILVMGNDIYLDFETCRNKLISMYYEYLMLIEKNYKLTVDKFKHELFEIQNMEKI